MGSSREQFLGPSVLPYLDTSISLPTTEDGGFTSKVFRKHTYTGLISNFSVVCPQKWKFGLIQCLLHRAYTISSCWLTFSQVDFLKSVFSQNGYPEDLLTSYLRRFVNNKCDKSTQNSKIKEDRVETIFFIPYIGLLPSYLVGNSRNCSKNITVLTLELFSHLSSEKLFLTEVAYSPAFVGKCSL